MTERDRFVAYCRRRFAEDWYAVGTTACKPEALAARLLSIPEDGIVREVVEYHNMLCYGPGCTTMGSGNADS